MISLLVSALLMVGDTAATVTVPPAIVEPKKERKICKRDQVTTSLYGSKRTCMTATQWKERERKATLEDLGSVTTK